MLDLRHPRSQHVLEAARIEDGIRQDLRAWQQSPALDGPLAVEAALERVAQLRDLNAAHFQASAGIARTLDTLAGALGRADPQGSREAFARLAEGPGDNFGTWAI